MPPADGQVPIFLSATDYDLPEPLPQGLAKYSNFRDLARGGFGHAAHLFRTDHRPDDRDQDAPAGGPPRREGDHRLLWEARVTAQLQHPNTVPVYEISRDVAEGFVLHDEAGLGRARPGT